MSACPPFSTLTTTSACSPLTGTISRTRTSSNPPGVQQRKIYWRLPTDFGDRDLRTDQYRWLLERVEALHRILAPRVKALPVPE